MNYQIQNKLLKEALKKVNKPILFYGASLFLENFLKQNSTNNAKIIGIIDKNPKKTYSTINGIKIYPPEYLQTQSDIAIICTILNNNQEVYAKIKSVLNNIDNKRKIELLPNIFLQYEHEKYKTILDVDVIKPNEKDIELLESLGNEYLSVSEMQNLDRIFLTSLINNKKPKKLLEVGVAQGGSSILMLNAIKNIKKAKLYSLDLLKYHYVHKDKKVGHFVDNYPELKKNWTLRTGGLSLEFLDSISSSKNENEKFDFCFLDTAHRLPGEILDYLQVLPYLKKNATVCFHDTNLHVFDPANAIATNLLMSAVSGRRIIPYLDNKTKYTSSINTFVCNIGAIQLDNNAHNNLFPVFNLLTLKWDYKLKKEYLIKLSDFYARHYGQYYGDFLLNAANIQKVINQKNQSLG